MKKLYIVPTVSFEIQESDTLLAESNKGTYDIDAKRGFLDFDDDEAAAQQVTESPEQGFNLDFVLTD